MEFPAALAAIAPADLFEVCRTYHVQQLDLFGSAAGDGFDPARSDLDFLVTFEDPLPDEGVPAAYFGLMQALCKLYGRKVDLVTEQLVANPYLRRRIETQRRRLFPPA